jgi:crotonobetainyl-CoA:carnitine CoA-transferase CaiB-like acyl-CoA transferase
LTLHGPASTIVDMDPAGDNSRTGAYHRPAPWLGQHAAQVLGDELGVSGAEGQELAAAGIVYNKHPEAAQ